MFPFTWQADFDAPLTEWLLNTVLSVLWVGVMGAILLSFLPKHRLKPRSTLIIGVFLLVLAMLLRPSQNGPGPPHKI